MLKDKPMASIEELVISNMLEVQSLIKILERKGLITQDKILKEVEMVKKAMKEEIRRIQIKN
jgi:hypothetical protein